MAQEIELKLRLSTEDIPLLSRWLDDAATFTGLNTLKNDYYDTPGLDLSAAHSALRIRSTEGGFEQTLKARSQSQNAVQVRHEWNWPLTERSLDRTLLALPDVAGHWPAGVPVEQLHLVFSTDFERRSWLLVFEAEGQPSEIEVVIDRGDIWAGELSAPLCEVELELKNGDALMLWPVLEQMQSLVPLWLSDVSKAERGYRLAGVPPQHYHGEPVRKDGSGLAEQIFDLQRALERLVWEPPVTRSVIEDVWRTGFPLLCLLSEITNDISAAEPACKALSYLLRMDYGNAAGEIRADKSAARSLTLASQQLAEMWHRSQPDFARLSLRWSEARSQVNDVIECSTDNTLFSSLTDLLRQVS